MKRYKVVPSKASVTSITVEGLPLHFFHSKLLGRCRAIVIAEDENLPVPLALTPKAIDLIEASLKKPKKPAPIRCRECGCQTIRIMTVGKHPPAYICGLCDAWLGDVE